MLYPFLVVKSFRWEKRDFLFILKVYSSIMCVFCLSLFWKFVLMAQWVGLWSLIMASILTYCLISESLCAHIQTLQLTWFNTTIMTSIEPRHAKTCLMAFASYKGADQPAHPCRLISTFFVGCLDSRIANLSKSRI